MKNLRVVLTSCVALSALTLTSCETPEQTGALAGGAFGASIGALSGGTGVGRKAALGGVIGAGAGALLGHMLGRADRRGYYEGERLPYGRYVGRGLVESPYRPYNLISVRGIPSGAVVEDPSTGRLFINP